MAGKPFKLSVVSDVSDVIRGNRDIEGSFEDVADSLDDVARESGDAGREIADGLRDGVDDAARDVDRATGKIGDSLEATGDDARDAGRDIERHLDDAAGEGQAAADKLERSFKEAFDEVKGTAKTATADVARDTRTNFDDAGDGIDTFKDEARSGLSEALSGFRGEVEEIPDLIQGVFGGITADLGVGGMVGAGLVAAGAGLAIRFYEDWKEQSEKVEERIADMYDDMLESGNDYLSTSFLNTQISDILNSAEGAVIDYARAQEIAAATGLSLADVVRGYAGDADAAKLVQDTLTEKMRETNEEFQRTRDDGYLGAANELGGHIDQLRDYRDSLEEVGGQVATANERAEVYRQAQLTGSEAVRDHVAALAAYDEALRDARDAIAENNDEIKNNSDRALANQGVLGDLATEMLGLRDSAREAGAGTADLTALQLEQAGQFIDTAEAAGIGQDEALNLATALGLVPEDVATRIREQGADHVIDQARAAAGAARAAADGEYTVNMGVSLPSQREMQERLNALAWGLAAPAATVRVRYGQNIE